jgi:hypothetical protein
LNGPPGPSGRGGHARPTAYRRGVSHLAAGLRTGVTKDT